MCSSAGTGPAQVAVAIRDRDRRAIEGEVAAAVDLAAARRLSRTRASRTARASTSDESDNFFVGNSFPTCGINFSAQEIMGQTKENQ